MKNSLTIFLFACTALSVLITCSDKNNIKRNIVPITSTATANTEIPNQQLNTTEDLDDKEPKQYLGNCFIKIHNWFYDLNPITPKDHNLLLKSPTGENIEYNICNDVQTDCTYSRGLLVQKENCNLFANTRLIDKEWVLKGKQIINFSRG
jgi:hypothetical protein